MTEWSKLIFISEIAPKIIVCNLATILSYGVWISIEIKTIAPFILLLN